MKILLTGANGFLGKTLFNFLSNSHIVYKLSRSNSDFISDLSLNVPDFNQKFDLVIHAAGKAHFVPKNSDNIDIFYENNVLGTLNLLKGLSNFGLPKYFVYISSVSVYGLDTGELINESALLAANDPYGYSKIQAEQIIRSWCLENNVVCTILRLPLVVGSNPPGNLGLMIKAIRYGYYFNIGDSSARKSMVLASDIAKYIIKASQVGGVYNLTDGFHPSFDDLSQYISKQLCKAFVPKIPYFIAFLLAKFGDGIGENSPINSKKFYKITSTLTFDDSNARLAFGWMPCPVLTNFSIN